MGRPRVASALTLDADCRSGGGGADREHGAVAALRRPAGIRLRLARGRGHAVCRAAPPRTHRARRNARGRTAVVSALSRQRRLDRGGRARAPFLVNARRRARRRAGRGVRGGAGIVLGTMGCRARRSDRGDPRRAVGAGLRADYPGRVIRGVQNARGRCAGVRVGYVTVVVSGQLLKEWIMAGQETTRGTVWYVGGG